MLGPRGNHGALQNVPFWPAVSKAAWLWPDLAKIHLCLLLPCVLWWQKVDHRWDLFFTRMLITGGISPAQGDPLHL